MKPRLVIAGAGPTGRALARRTLAQWRPLVIDIRPEALERLVEVEGIETICGDATSTLVLKKADLEDVFSAVAATGSDEVNREFCRLLREMFGIRNFVALVHDPEVAEEFKEEGVTTVSRPISVASIIESHLDSGRRTTADVGLGIGEIYEVTVQSHSPVIGKTLRILRPQSWILGAIYREGELVVPHGNTQIEANDKCLLIGDPEVLPGIADYFQRGSSEFPLQFGTRYCLVDQPELPNLEECRWLVENTEAKGIGVLHNGQGIPQEVKEAFPEGTEMSWRNLTEDWPANLMERGDQLDCAMMIVSSNSVDWRDRMGFGNKALVNLLDQTPEPVLISRGSHPYKRILLAVSPSPGSRRADELAVDVARKFEAELTAVGVLNTDFVVGPEYKAELEAALEAARSVAHLYSIKIDTQLVEGNPVHQILDMCKDYDLLIVAHRRQRRFSMTQVDVSRHLVLRAPCSVMALPFMKDDLPHGG